jgi:hypothetical protein
MSTDLVHILSIDSAVTKIGDYKVDFLTSVSRASGELFDEKKPEVENLVSRSL